jgi:hypothetical protein
MEADDFSETSMTNNEVVTASNCTRIHAPLHSLHVLRQLTCELRSLFKFFLNYWPQSWKHWLKVMLCSDYVQWVDIFD